jgi:hypothetical protein
MIMASMFKKAGNLFFILLAFCFLLETANGSLIVEMSCDHCRETLMGQQGCCSSKHEDVKAEYNIAADQNEQRCPHGGICNESKDAQAGLFVSHSLPTVTFRTTIQHTPEIFEAAVPSFFGG